VVDVDAGDGGGIAGAAVADEDAGIVQGAELILDQGGLGDAEGHVHGGDVEAHAVGDDVLQGLLDARGVDGNVGGDAEGEDGGAGGEALVLLLVAGVAAGVAGVGPLVGDHVGGGHGAVALGVGDVGVVVDEVPTGGVVDGAVAV